MLTSRGQCGVDQRPLGRRADVAKKTSKKGKKK